MKPENHGTIDSEQLLSFIERIEHLNADMAAIADDVKQIYADAKSAGYDPKYIRECIKLRKKDADEIDEHDELLQMYRNAIGL